MLLDAIRKDFYRGKVNGRHVIAAVSGGKDSAALSLFLKELEIPHERVFMDTGWEHAKTYEYLRGELTRVVGPITEIRAERQMEALIEHKGMFPSRTHRFCTDELKVKPLKKYIRQRQDEVGEVLDCVGIRNAESLARSQMSEWDWEDGFDCAVWRPLVKWSVQDVIDIHKRHGLAPNPLYLMGADRVGCWPCIYARKAEVRLVAEKDPGRIARIRELEARTKTSAQARYAAKGETLESLGYQDPAFFQARTGRKGMWPIDRVAEWSKTSHGGKEFEPFVDDKDGCMRWGMCETTPPDEPKK